MATDEEYLDNLLKSLAENEPQPRTMDTVLKEMGKESTNNQENFPVSSDELADMLDQIEDKPAETSVDDSFLTENESKKSLIEEANDAIKNETEAESTAAEYFEENGTEAEKEVQLSSQEAAKDEVQDEAQELPNFENIYEADTHTAQPEAVTDADVTELIDQMENADDDLAEINGLLKKADNNESVEDDMLALLENVKDVQSEDEKNVDKDAFHSFEGADTRNPDDADEVLKEDSEAENKKDKKKEKKNKKKLFGKEKRPGKEKIPDGVTGFFDESDIQVNEEKKPGFFARILTLLTQEEEPELSLDENDEILKELDEEDREKRQEGKKKRNKKDKKQKDKKNENSTDEDSIEEKVEEKKGKKEKKKKEKREKKEKVSKDKNTEKPVRVLSRKNILLLVALCATLVAGIFALSTFLPDYSDKQAARTAFYEGDYETVYQLLYDKRLSNSDALLFNRVRTVLKLERKVEAYNNNLKLGRKIEALDALLQGVNCYSTLSGIDEYGVRDEIDAIYAEICNILIQDYQISAEDAAAINSLDNTTYTQKLNSVINGTEFTMPGEKAVPQEPLPPQDILPAEDEIINY